MSRPYPEQPLVFSGTMLLVLIEIALGLGVERGLADDTVHRSALPTRQEWLDTLRDDAPAREHHTWGIFLGTGWSPEALARLRRQWQVEGMWRNPLTDQPFDDVRVYVFGHDNALLEGVRVLTDHLELHPLSLWEELAGQHFTFVICHSNGCINAIDAHRQGLIHVDQFFALGTDWTSKNFSPGDLRGATITFFIMKGDPIWKLPAPTLAPIGQDALGLKWSIPFDRPQDIATGLGHLFTQGRADPDRFPVIRLDPLPQRRGTITHPFRAHSLVESYFAAIDQWRRKGGDDQKTLTEQIRQRKATGTSDEERKAPPLPPGGGGGGPGGTGALPQRPGGGRFYSTPAPDPRSGVSADIHITPRDFRAP